MHDNNYPSGFQTEDRKIRITAKVEPAKANANVYFRTYDPDDRSSYETDTKGDDNHEPIRADGSTMKRGSLSAVPGYAVIPGSEVSVANGSMIYVEIGG